VPSLHNILLMRKLANGNVNEDYVFFCDRFFKCIVRVSVYNERWDSLTTMSDIATPSDEALALLILENNEARWLQEFELQRDPSLVEAKASLPKAKYTNSGKNSRAKGFTKRFGGWSNAGIERFNELLRLVKEDRNENGQWFDGIVLERKRNKDAEKSTANKSTGIVKADNDLFDYILNRSANDFLMQQELQQIASDEDENLMGINFEDECHSHEEV
jgi:hypothetical protein